MKKQLSLLTAALLLTGASSAFAASSTELTVTGFITPAACTPTLANGGNIDLGQVPVKDLNATTWTEIDKRIVAMTVSCNSPIEFALTSIDSQRGSASFPTLFYGLGLINGTQKLGGYSVTVRNPMADGIQVQTIASTDEGKTWDRETILEENQYMSVGSMADDSKPIAVKDLMLDLEVRTLIARTDGLDLTNEVPINGLVTLEVKYL